jgi:AcrR family transcriptional regulator
MSAVQSVLDQKRDAVRSGLGRIALELFADRGFDAVTVEDIARNAGISPRTFFRYFASKDDIVLDYQSRLQDRLASAFEARPAAEGAVEALENALIATSRVTPAERQRWLQVGRIMTSSAALREAAFGRPLSDSDALVAGVAGRLGARPDDPRARAVVAAMLAVATTEWNAWVDDGHGEPSERIAQALRLLDEGLGGLNRSRGRTR